jgi:HTH-type transcriptional regulator, sugar sensing transcriptional regulator
MKDVVDYLMQLGLNEYEAKAYIATVALGEGTIKEISDESGVPRSRAYDVMERLAEKGLVELGNSTPLIYRANEPTKAANHLMDEIRAAGDEVSKYLNDIGRRTEKRDNPIWTLKGDWAINHKVCEMIDAAKKDIEIVCVNNRHLIRYAKYIAEASKSKSITIVISHQPESFLNLLGSARIMKFREFWREGEGSKMGEMSERGFTTKDGKYNLELSLLCDRNDSMILSREGEGYRAIFCNGTVISYFFQEMMDQIIDHADPIKN